MKYYEDKINNISGKVSLSYKRWIGYSLVAFWLITVCGVIFVLYDSISGNSIISSNERYIMLKMKQETISDLKAIKTTPEAVINGFNLTGSLTTEAEKSLELLDSQTADTIREMITSYALAQTLSENKVARTTKHWSFIALICYVLSLPLFLIGLKILCSTAPIRRWRMPAQTDS